MKCRYSRTVLAAAENGWTHEAIDEGDDNGRKVGHPFAAIPARPGVCPLLRHAAHHPDGLALSVIRHHKN